MPSEEATQELRKKLAKKTPEELIELLISQAAKMEDMDASQEDLTLQKITLAEAFTDAKTAARVIVDKAEKKAKAIIDEGTKALRDRTVELEEQAVMLKGDVARLGRYRDDMLAELRKVVSSYGAIVETEAQEMGVRMESLESGFKSGSEAAEIPAAAVVPAMPVPFSVPMSDAFSPSEAFERPVVPGTLDLSELAGEPEPEPEQEYEPAPEPEPLDLSGLVPDDMPEGEPAAFEPEPVVESPTYQEPAVVVEEERLDLSAFLDLPEPEEAPVPEVSVPVAQAPQPATQFAAVPVRPEPVGGLDITDILGSMEPAVAEDDSEEPLDLSALIDLDTPSEG